MPYTNCCVSKINGHNVKDCEAHSEIAKRLKGVVYTYNATERKIKDQDGHDMTFEEMDAVFENKGLYPVLVYGGKPYYPNGKTTTELSFANNNVQDNYLKSIEFVLKNDDTVSMYQLINEKTNNKTSVIANESETLYPNNKAVKNYVDAAVNELIARIEALENRQ